MSRIYEALKLAESERTSTEQKSDPNVSISSDPNTPEQMEKIPNSPETIHTERIPSGTGIPASPVLSFNVSQLKKTSWNPSIESLPALLSSGSAVEQFRSLRSRIYELRSQTHQLKSILISSGLPQEGKSFIAVNLALILARHKDSKVLLIDGDMRRSTLHKLLGCEAQPGIVDHLLGNSGIVEVMQKIDQNKLTVSRNFQPLSNLTFIPGGISGDMASDLSGSHRFNELLATASTHFDWIIIDSSPVIPVSDAVNLARSCDGVLLVAREGVTKYQVAQRAVEEFKSSNILGFVLNAVIDPPENGSYYGYDSQDKQ